MNTRTISLVCIIACLVLSCKTKQQGFSNNYPSGEVLYLSQYSERNVIALQSKGFGKNHDEALFDAEKRAINQLLFRGIANSSSSVPLIRESSMTESQKTQLDRYFADLSYREHLTYVQRSESKERDKQARMITSEVIVKVDLLSLRRDLEQAGIMPKFGL